VYGRKSIHVLRRLRELLIDLADSVRDVDRPKLESFLTRVETCIAPHSTTPRIERRRADCLGRSSERRLPFHEQLRIRSGRHLDFEGQRRRAAARTGAFVRCSTRREK